MYGIFTYVWDICRIDVAEYSIHGAYGYMQTISIVIAASFWHPVFDPWHRPRPPLRLLRLPGLKPRWQVGETVPRLLSGSLLAAHAAAEANRISEHPEVPPRQSNLLIICVYIYMYMYVYI